MKKLRVLSLFDGISSGQLALERVGIPIEVYYASEIDKYAMQITQKNYPDTIQLGDVEKIDFTQYEGKIDLLIGGSPCFVADTLVMTDCGFKSIQDIKVGDYVLTHKSRYRKVLNIGNKVVNKLYKIKGFGFDEILTTEEHPFYAREMYRKWNAQRRSSDRLFTSPKWIKTKDLHKNHYLSSTFNVELKNSFNVYTTDFWYFIGRFTGDGWVRQTKRKYRKNSYIYQVLICCSKNEKHELKEIFDKVGYNYNFSEERTTYKFRICNEDLVRFLKQCGTGAKNKIVHPMLWNLPIEFKKAFLEGYMSADGNFNKSKNLFSATTISRELAYGVKQLAMEVYNTCPKIYFVKTKSKKILEGRIINQQNQYIINYFLQKNKQDKAFFENNISWQPYKLTEIIEKQSVVYNLEVEEDNSYTANTIIVHNCTNLSIAGNRKGLEGDESRLFWEYVRAIRECKPKWFLLENVESMTDNDREIISKELGCYPIMINSSLVSAQNRKRYYWFNWGDKQYNLFGMPTCNIPLPKDSGIVVEDVIESGLVQEQKSRAIISSIGRTTTREYFKKHQGLMIAEPVRLSEYEKSNGQAQRVYSIKGKSICLNANGSGQGGKTGLYKFDLPDGSYIVRKPTPLECERLQTLPDNYTKGISNTQRYKCIGNGWTVDVISYIFSFLKQDLTKL